jgi:hypothetical protein
VKTVLTILFSLALIGSQNVFTAEPSSCVDSLAPNCCCAECDCVSSQPNTPQPLPPTPARTVSQNQVQLILVVAAQLLSQPTMPAQPLSVTFASPNFQVDAPLYQRNCAYLI